MSDEKHEQLIAEGKLRPDGSRIEKCPVCAQELPEHLTAAALAEAEHAVATPETVEVLTATPNASEGEAP